MTRDQARILSNQVIEDRKKAELQTAEYERKQHQKMLNENKGLYTSRALIAITAACQDGQTSTVITGDVEELMLEAKADLEYLGYNVSKWKFVSGDTNYGDSAAPCIMTYRCYQFEVSWK